MLRRAPALVFAICLVFVASCSSGGGSGGATPSGGTGSQNGSGGGPGVNAATGDTLLGPNGSILFIPEAALGQNTPISVGNGQNIPLPNGVAMAGPAIQAAPAGLRFLKPAVIGVPVNPSLIPDGVEPSELRVYAQEADGSVLSVPAIGYDPIRGLLYAAIGGFTTFQAAVPMFDFAIVPQTIKMAFIGAFYSETLSFRNNSGGVTWEVVSTMQTAGEAPESEEEAPVNQVAPGLTLSSTGTISGFPNTYGTWAITLRATDSATPEANVAEVSHT
ncbi:MAG: hypothetical protein KDB07_09815, partial [Planctomycetes bacterium]|nr:hypothetical protein [Planctomycetota bacterium]